MPLGIVEMARMVHPKAPVWQFDL